ncbi:hypothetical protein HPB48_008476 [Haemaphysalis longicornis]|uniref:ABC transmembrane type-1 domain-containing protein n=1 Tax=Haemaphysalis longicornis TaxID=44386 RepID=A0A9J6FDP0_HAELO|nr:hypothetical protein HPB48_008476 [Haemaphysalis longicornis]
MENTVYFQARFSTPRVVISVVLKWIALVSLLLAWPELRQRTLPNTRIKCFSLLDVTYLLGLAFVSLVRFKNGQAVSGFIWAVLGLLCTAGVADFAGRYRALHFVEHVIRSGALVLHMKNVILLGKVEQRDLPLSSQRMKCAPLARDVCNRLERVQECTCAFAWGTESAAFSSEQSTGRQVVLRRMVRLSPRALSRNPSGHVLALLSGDCLQVCIACTQFPLPITGVVVLPFTIYLLGERVGAGSALFTAIWPAIAIALIWPATVLQDRLWDRVLSLRDERLKQTTDLLTSVRLLKMYAWEDAFGSIISRLREKEEEACHRANVLDGLVDSVYTSSASIVSALRPVINYSC